MNEGTEGSSIQTHIYGDRMYLSAAPFHRTVSKFHYCAYEPAVTKTLIKNLKTTHQDMQFDTFQSK